MEQPTATEQIDIEKAFQAIRKKAIVTRNEPLAARKSRLKKLQAWIENNNAAIQQAVYEDFKKPAEEADISEIYPVMTEIREALSNLKTWAKPSHVEAPLTMVTTSSEIQYEPRGACLIIAPWNYPFNLAIGPLIPCLAAGNTAIIKPSEMTPHTSELIARMIADIFNPEEVHVINGGVDVSQQLLALPFDHIFFTGSPQVGKIVMRAAADHLTSVTLELGGKSPAIIDQEADLKDAAEKIAWGKFLNNGQTCIAPDYVIIDKSQTQRFEQVLIEATNRLFSNNGDFKSSSAYGRIVNEKHFNRLNALLHDALNKGATLLLGGDMEADGNYMSPTVLGNIGPDMEVSDEEIFGPILPIIEVGSLEETIEYINAKPKPLALYYFGKSKANRKRVLSQTSSGNVCVNDCMIHFGHPNLPFGGVNHSGIGKSHGKAGFLEFSNQKGVLKQRVGFTATKLVYPPYTGTTRKIINLLKKFF